ncbi:MAG: DUF2155 domain-containing protein [Alphaproteobacteria bacterium]
MRTSFSQGERRCHTVAPIFDEAIERGKAGPVMHPGRGGRIRGMTQSMKIWIRGARVLAGAFAAAAVIVPLSLPAQAEMVKNSIAVFAALDKVTGRISHLEIPMDQTVEFGALKVTPRACDTRPPTEAPHTATFVEVDEVTLAGEQLRIFTGWMFAESPGLHAVEHPVFDVWLTSCKMPIGGAPSESAENAPSEPGAEGEAMAEPAPAPAAPAPPPAAAPAPPPAAAAPRPRPAPPPGPGGLPWLPNAPSRSP